MSIFTIPTNEFELVNKSITSLLDYNEVKAIKPKNPLSFIRNETEHFICYRLFNKQTASINLTIQKNVIDNLNELVGFTSDANHRKSMGILKAILEHKVNYEVKTV